MLKVKRITIERLNNGEALGFQMQIEIATAHLTLESDQEMIGAYKTVLLAYELALKSNTRNSHTAEVVHIDDLTDRAWRGLHSQIKVALKHPNEDYRTTAIESNIIIRNYGDITAMGYNEKYGVVFKSLQDLNVLSEEKQKQIGIYDWLVELQTRYDEFMLASTARIEEEAHHITGLVKNMRDRADRAYRELMEDVNALIRIKGEEDYARFVAHVNVIIESAKAVLAARKTRAKHNTESNDSLGVDKPFELTSE